MDVASDEMSQTFTVLSSLPLTIRFPSGLKLTLLTSTACPLSVSAAWPVWASQTFSVLSQLPLTIRFPSGLKLTLVTTLECPSSVSVSWPVWASQTFSVPSLLPLTIRFPSGLDVRARFPCGDVAAKMRR